jgi:uncharacterized protein (UPF0332 family)
LKPETQAHIAKARRCVIKARAELSGARDEPALIEDAARNAYYIAFHAAQALIFERTDTSAKTHTGVHRQFHRLTRDEFSISRPLRTFINSAYDFKTAADYETHGSGRITFVRAQGAVDTAERLLEAVVALIEA